MSDETSTLNTDTDQDTASEAQEAVGKLLRETREQAGLDVADVARVLRISQRYLEALEDGRNADLPGPTYAIGFVRSYADHLGLDGEEIVRRYKSEADGVGKKADLVFPKPIPDSGVPGGAVLGLGVIVAAVAYGVWYYNSTQDDVAVERVEPVPERLVAEDDATPQDAAQDQRADDAQAAAVANEQASAEAQDMATAEMTAPVADTAADAQDAAPVAQAEAETVAETVEQTVADEPAPAQDAEKVAQDAPPATASEAQTAQQVDDAQQSDAPAGDAVEAEDTSVSTAEQTAEGAPDATDDATVDATGQAVTEVAPEPAAEPTADQVAEPAPVDEGPSRITIRAKSNSWIQVRDEALDRLLFTRLLRAGDEYEVPGRTGLQLMTGNAGALEILVDGEVVPPIGAVREVKRNIELDPDALKSGAVQSGEASGQ